MKKLLLIFNLALLMLMYNSCKKEEAINDPTPPTIELDSENVSTAPGDIFWINANLSDDVGLKNVNLLYSGWYLDKNIDLSDSTRKEYRLSYQFLTPADATDEVHTILLTVQDAGNNVTTRELKVRLDKDILPPEFKVTKPDEGMSYFGGDKLSFFIEVTDNVGIDTFQVSAPDLGIDTTIVFNPVNPKYIFVKDYYIPDPIADGVYFINLFASDNTGNKTDQAISVMIGEIQADVVYCVGGASFGGWQPDNPMPMQPDEADPDWFETYVYSWGIQDYNNIKFIGQKSWGPLNWGLDPNNPEVMINAENSEAIILAEEGYYKVRFSPSLLEYSAEKVEATTPLLPQMYLMGSGIVGMDMAWDDPSKSLAMIQDPDNQYIYTAEVEFTDVGFEDWGANFIFIANTNDVSDFNLGFRNIPEESLDPDWLDYPGYVVGDLSMDLDELTDGELSKISEDPPSSVWNNVPYIAYYLQAGTYEIKLDYHIKQASITKVSK